MPSLDAQIKSNRRRSHLLFLGFFLVYAVLGTALSWFLGAWPVTNNVGPLIVFFIVAIVIAGLTLSVGDDMTVLVARAHKIKSKEESPLLWDAVETMSIASGQNMPRIYLSPDPAPNAFAAGRSEKQALICVNQGLLDLLDKDELEAVVAHEMSHIRNMDVRLMTYAAVLAGGIALISEVLSYMLFWGGGDSEDSGAGIVGVIIAILAIILAPLAAMLIQMSISRKREYLADASAAELTKYPQALASALRRLDQSDIKAETGSTATAHLCIVAPLKKRGKKSSLFSTHPPIEKRIARLDQLAEGQEYSRRPISEM